jgi:hypothetical protein
MPTLFYSSTLQVSSLLPTILESYLDGLGISIMPRRLRSHATSSELTTNSHSPIRFVPTFTLSEPRIIFNESLPDLNSTELQTLRKNSNDYGIQSHLQLPWPVKQVRRQCAL